MHSLGILSWDDILSFTGTFPMGTAARERLCVTVTENREALVKEDLQYLTTRFIQADQWRILHRYADDVSYFDLETTGLSRVSAQITVIVCLHKGEFHTFVRNENLTDFLDLLDDVKLLSSFNGKSFDIPFVLDSFRIPELPCPHIDLRWVCYHAGLRGGLKAIEGQLGMERPPEIRHIDGTEAIALWYMWEKEKDAACREALIKYCTADVGALKTVAKKAVDKMMDL